GTAGANGAGPGAGSGAEGAPAEPGTVAP
ncbi:MAG: hypothetical protein AVDCRST_MAG35-231, partial [uncultured Quadrisphaera sp.]